MFTLNRSLPYRILLICFVLALLAVQLIAALTHATAPAAPLYPLLPGFPREVPGRVSSPPIVADLDRDGRYELLVATDLATIYAWNASGSLLPGFPLTTSGRIDAPLALGDLNGDGDLEIVAGISSATVGVAGQVFVWQPDGTLLPGWPQRADLFDPNDNSEIRTVVLADLDNNSKLDVIAGTDNNILGTPAPGGTQVPNLYVWDQSGHALPGNWPAKDGPAIRGTVAAGDLNSDGRMDLVVGRDYQWLFAYDQLGNALPGWPIETLVPHNGGDQNVDPRVVHKRSMPTLADLDGDGIVECIVAGIRKLPGSEVTVNNDLLVLEPNGTRRPGWETAAGGTGFLGDTVIMDQAPAIADLNGDGQLDIVVPTQDGWIRAYRADKTLLWQFNYAQGQKIWSSEPVIGDIDNDGRYEVTFGTYDPVNGTAGPVGLWILEHDGTVKAGSPMAVSRPGITAAPTLTDLNGDGALDIIAASRDGTIYAWNAGVPLAPTRLPWPVARQNIQRTALTPKQSGAGLPGNLLKNPGFELDVNSDGGPDSWSNNSKFTRSNAITPHEGSLAGRFGATDNSGVTIIQSVPNVTAGKTYSLSGWVNIPAQNDTTFTFKIQVQWKRADNTTISTSTVKRYTAQTSGWNQAAKSLTAPVGTTNAQIRMVASSLNGVSYMDDFVFQ